MSIETMTKIGTYTVNTVGGEASVTFNNIPQDYNDLVVKASLRSERAASLANPVLTINGDTTSIYYRKELYAEGSTGGEYVSDRVIGGMPAASIAANVFGNLDLYISNYSGNFWKNYNFDTGSPSTTTSNYSIWSGSTLYYNTAPVTSLTFTVNGGANYSRYSTFTLYGVKNARKTIGNSIKATGGIVSFDGTYVYHTFNTTSLFIPSTSGIFVDIAQVAGGGAGGAHGQNASGAGGAGGGAGGLLQFANQYLTNSPIAVTIGAGGSGVASQSAQGGDGSSSRFGSLTASVGGGGGGGGGSVSDSNVNGRSGGSGGGQGGVAGATIYRSGLGTSGQGNDGGGINHNNRPGNGGGGSSSAGTVGGWNGDAGNGGSGTTVFNLYAVSGGGGGGWYQSGTTNGLGGLGGGGNGGNVTTYTGNSGRPNTGGGGGGAGWTSASAHAGGNGGSGVVIIRYKA